MQNDLLVNLDRLHTTQLGVIRVIRNLGLDTSNIVEWCREKIETVDHIARQNRNIHVEAVKMTV